MSSGSGARSATVRELPDGGPEQENPRSARQRWRGVREPLGGRFRHHHSAERSRAPSATAADRRRRTGVHRPSTVAALRPAAAGRHDGGGLVTPSMGSALDQPTAHRLTMNIQLRLDTIADNIEQVLPMIEQARTGQAHEALGYKSWTAYVQDKFGGRLDRLKRAERQPIVELLADTGMSTRAIATVVGVHHDTVASDIRAAAAPVGFP